MSDPMFGELAGKVGQEMGLSDWVEMPQSRIDAFADVTEDWQFLHNDPARAAAEGPFGGTIAHGYLTLAMLSCMSYQALPWILTARVSMNYGFERLRFPAPVLAGSRVRGHFVLADLDQVEPDTVTLRWDVTVEVEGSTKPAIVARWITRHEYDLVQAAE